MAAYDAVSETSLEVLEPQRHSFIPMNVLNASPNELAECAEKKLYPPPRDVTKSCSQYH